ncbi:MAG: histidine phosphatase family protein [Acetobacteraceae bacterium]
MDAVLQAARAMGLEARTDAFLFCRHGQTAGNAQRFYQHPHEPLDAEGHAQAARAAAIIAAGPRPTRVLASDMARAWLTAGHIASAGGFAVQPAPGLRERCFGALVGASSEGFDWRRDPPGGETLDAFVSRTLAGLSDALSDGGTPLLVAHGGTLLVIAGALGLPLDPSLRANAVPLLVRRCGATWGLRLLEGG